MPDKHPDGEGPIDDPVAAKQRAKAEHGKAEHAYRDKPDPRDLAGDADLDDETKQEKE